MNKRMSKTAPTKAPVINPKNFVIGGKLFKNKTQLYAYISAYINPKPAVVTQKQVLKRGKNGTVTPI